MEALAFEVFAEHDRWSPDSSGGELIVLPDRLDRRLTLGLDRLQLFRVVVSVRQRRIDGRDIEVVAAATHTAPVEEAVGRSCRVSCATSGVCGEPS
jgi:hypothetical protein